MAKPPSQEAIAAARWRAFQTIEETADLAASYARSIGEAAYRGDALTVSVHLRQLIDCVRSMARVYREEIDHQDLAGAESKGPDGAREQAEDGN